MKQRQTAQIIYEDNHLIAANKPVGWLSQGDETGDWTLMDEMKRYIKWKYEKPGDVFLGSFHRIDRPASGVMIYAKTSKALTRMNALIKDRQIKKEYLIVTERRPLETADSLIHYMEKDKKRNISKAYDMKKKNRKESKLNYEMVGFLNQSCLIKVDLETGRSHQIRVQMSKIGANIIGDVKYGASKKMNNRGIALHCHSMSFIHPVKKEPITIKAEMPKSFPFDAFRELGY